MVRLRALEVMHIATHGHKYPELTEDLLLLLLLCVFVVLILLAYKSSDI